MQKHLRAIGVLSTAAIFGSAGALAQSYTSQKLATLGGSSNYGQAINNKGQVAGFSATTGDITYDPYLTGVNGSGILDAGSLGGYTLAYAVNDLGQVAGYGQPGANTNGQAFVTGPNASRITALGTLTSTTFSRATGVNNDGKVVGYIGDTSTNSDMAFITGPKGVGMQALGTLGGATSVAYAINNAALVVGYSNSAGGADVSFVTMADGKSMRDLGVGGNTSAAAINNSAQVAGTGSDISNDIYGYVTAPNGGPAVRIGTLGGANSYAFGVSNTGQVVGWSQVASGDYHAYVYRNGAVLDLNNFVTLAAGTVLVQATAINDRGQIVVQGSDSYTYLLSPPVAEQFASVAQVLGSAGAGVSLAGKFSQAQAYFSSRDRKDACLMLSAFTSDVKSQSSKVLAPALALELLADAQGLEAAIACDF